MLMSSSTMSIGGRPLGMISLPCIAGPSRRRLAYRRRLPLAMPHRQSIRAIQTNAQDTSSIAQVLSSQDPLGRITYLRQSVGRSLAMYKARQDFPDDQVVGLEPYLIPFWLVSNLSLYSIYAVNPSSPEYSQPIEAAFYTNLGLSISAVSPDHWASGLIMRDDTSALYDAIVEDPEIIHLDYPLQEYDLGTTDPLNQWDPERAPLFHFSYPILNDREYEFVGQVLGYRMQKDMDTDRPIDASEPSVYGIPYYRVVYRVQLASGEYGLLDSAEPNGRKSTEIFDFSHFHLTTKPTPGRLNIRDVEKSRQYMPFFVSGSSIGVYFKADVRFNNKVDELFLRAQRRRGPGIKWKDPNILPVVSQTGDRTDLIALRTFWAECIPRRLNPDAPPQFFPVPRPLYSAAQARKILKVTSNPATWEDPSIDDIPNVSAESIPQKLPRSTKEPSKRQAEEKKENASAAAKKKQRDRGAKATQGEEAKKDTNGPSPMSMEEKRRAVRLQWMARHKEQAEKDRKEREEQAARDARNAHMGREAFQRDIEAGRRLRSSGSMGYTGIPVDVLGYYKLLQITPTPDFLNPVNASQIDSMLSTRYIELSKERHPDRNPDVDPQQQAELNGAFGHIKILDERLKYQGYGLRLQSKVNSSKRA
ncbi:hypothetical protein BCR39DRAFT_517789 [Naematelia encephala]|uniref:J domain-containing protein n=1 Tax=Naematelia encephala TaxID=71784 RepID=A0A1Y2BHS4_9TREE|nr:hypothetical protein BCR39DRAFT_517789 [Naematelia encephala]